MTQQQKPAEGDDDFGDDIYDDEPAEVVGSCDDCCVNVYDFESYETCGGVLLCESCAWYANAAVRGWA